MKKYLAALFFGLVATASYSQYFETEKKVLCSTPEQLFKELANEYRETMQWAGKGETSTYMLWVNAKTNTWTLTQSTKEISCIIGTGQGNHLFLGSQL